MGPVFLIGSRCVGKSAVGLRLAQRLGWAFVDADEELERRAGRTIREIFASEGETAFRDREAAVLADLAARADVVVATGGGVVLRPENRERLSAGPVVWLTARPQTLWARMQGDASTAERRPALAQGGLAEVESLLAQREPLYRACATWTFDTESATPDALADAIARRLAE